MRIRYAAFITLFTGAAATDVTPIEKVITLIRGLKEEVETDGKDEAAEYEKFACFCKDQTTEKSDSVKSGKDNIDAQSADIADKTAEEGEKTSELGGRRKNQEKLKTELDETTARCAKQKAEYEAEAADLDKAIQGLRDAIKAMKESKPSLLEIKKKIGTALDMADAMSLLSTPKHKATAALIQQAAGVDPEDPTYKYHSNDIIEVCENLLQDYRGNKKTLDEEWAKTFKACTETKKSLNEQITANKEAMDALEKRIASLKEQIGSHREALIEAKSLMQDDELYLKDLQKRCEDRANDYDQRSAMRSDELSALTQALKVLEGKVEEETEVNQRALLQRFAASAAAKTGSTKAHAPVAEKATGVTLKAISFLQDYSANEKVESFLAVSEQTRRGRALDYLRAEGQRLHSVALTSLAEHSSADPFKKVKTLIQRLIERLLTEAKNEATKKGFCDTEIGKAEKDREFRFQETKDISADLASLEAKRDALQNEIKDVTRVAKETAIALKESTKIRKEEKQENMQTLKTAKEGLEGVKEALSILRSFYKEAAKAAFVQASPVDEDTDGPGFSGNYKGKQSGMKAVFALLETLASDFDRTLRTTEEAEHRAHRDFVDFQQVAESTIAAKTTKKELDEQDLKTTLLKINSKMEDLQSAMDLLDAALKTLEQLKPTCIDTGMSYADRVAKREEEITALKKALEILKPAD